MSVPVVHINNFLPKLTELTQLTRSENVYDWIGKCAIGLGFFEQFSLLVSSM